MTRKDFDPSFHARTRMRAKFTRFHPSLPSQLFGNWLDAAITKHWPSRRALTNGATANPWWARATKGLNR